MRFQVGTNGKQYLLTIKLRLSSTTPDFGRPDAVYPMWTGGGYGEGYNDAQELKEVTIPEDVRRVEFVAHITGDVRNKFNSSHILWNRDLFELLGVVIALAVATARPHRIDRIRPTKIRGR